MSKRVSLHDRDDAPGISDAAAAKTATVVDTLIAPDVAAGDDRIVHIPVGKIVPHPRNRKILPEDVADLAASFKAGEPILNALGVTAAADWNAGKPEDLKPIQSDEFIITAGGHRRLCAAEVAGLKTVPCIIRSTFAGAEGRRAALLENLHRQDLDVFEEAEAFAELVGEPYKMSQRELSTVVFGKVNQQSHISKRLKLLKLPSTVREMVRLGKMHISDALALAGVVDNKPVFDLALTKIKQWNYDAERAVRLAQQEYDNQVARSKALEKVKAEGLATIDRSPAYGFYSKREPVRLEALGIAEDKHKAEPCHVAYVDRNDGQITIACKEPARHLTDGKSKLRASKKARDQVARYSSSGSSGNDAAVRRERKELKACIPARMAVAAEIVRGKHRFDKAGEQEFVRRGYIGNLWHSTAQCAEGWHWTVELLGGLVDGAYPHPEHTSKLAKVPHEWTLLAMSVVYFEGRIRANHSRWGDEQRYYLNVLAQHGYEISDVEHTKLGDKRTLADGWTSPTDSDVAAAAVERGDYCRLCGVAAQDLPAGVTLVADGTKCSGCADAQDAGWLEQQAEAMGTSIEELGEPIPEQTESDPVTCPACEGTGDGPDYAETSKVCERCKGDGVVDVAELVDAVPA